MDIVKDTIEELVKKLQEGLSEKENEILKDSLLELRDAINDLYPPAAQ